MLKPERKILVVDDDPVTQRLLLKWLKVGGYEVIAALDGKTGVQAAVAKVPDLILLDILMPDIDGTAVARQLIKNSRTKDIPIVFMTVMIKVKDDHGNKEIEVDGRKYRAFAKPLHNRKLLSEIRKLINRRLNQNSGN